MSEEVRTSVMLDCIGGVDIFELHIVTMIISELQVTIINHPEQNDVFRQRNPISYKHKKYIVAGKKIKQYHHSTISYASTKPTFSRFPIRFLSQYHSLGLHRCRHESPPDGSLV